MSSLTSAFNEREILSFIVLPLDGTYHPSPTAEPINFLKRHLHHLPPHLLTQFSFVTTPKQRAVIPTVRNRRLKYAESNPTDLSFTTARSTWPTLWEGREGRGVEEGKEEKEWAQQEFLDGLTKHVGKLGDLLGGYEEEREAERVRSLRREEAGKEEFIPEEDESDSDEDESEQVSNALANLEFEAEEDQKILFLRRVKERLIYGLLENMDYDAVDWDESLDTENDREAEERWFDDEEED
ncbi:uncharacterized protein BT62DRAFT_929082 [Guyanagaster necrorhizus]|uniref:CCD97-like C-terminal domain-containing protein n=1 Tax=Guyanagaster necrorhizus TaxID=856835 RepID=A0A9P7VYV6_9AGAR|nr:uncharacterized protein BT62DRAFT_929082 [Guyanagaster necrorhizus MCA 3950]KAG7449093.1 hypothetical protein BT62DRAFT_929082 [Guyanagaster necrorhizus MCA 3950]